MGSFAQRKDQKQDLTCKEVPLAAFLTLLTRGSCSAKEGTGGRAKRLGDQSGRNPRGRGLQGLGAEREEKRGIHNAFQLCFLGHWKNSLMEERLKKNSWWTGQGAHARSRWASK